LDLKEDLKRGEPLRQELKGLLQQSGASLLEASIAVEQLRASAFGEKWRETLARLERSCGLKGAAITNMMVRFSALLAFPPARIDSVVKTLTHDIGLPAKSVRYILTRRPSLFASKPEEMLAVRALLLSYGMRDKQIKVLMNTSPGILGVSAATLKAFVHTLGEHSDLEVEEIGAILRRCPWIVTLDLKKQVRPALEYLGMLGVGDVSKVVRSFPQVLALSRSRQVKRVYDILRELGLEQLEVVAVIESFPPILGLAIDAQILRVLEYLEVEVNVASDDLCKIVRAFPGILRLDVDDQMKPCVQFLRQVGIGNIARILVLIPPILGMDVATELVPKMRFLDKAGLTVFDMARFPQVFSYPLDTIIRPRLMFLKFLELPVTSKPLGLIIAPTDKDLCELTLFGISPELYARFQQRLPPIQLPERQRPKRVRTPPALQLTNTLQLKGDCRFPGYHQRLQQMAQQLGVPVAAPRATARGRKDGDEDDDAPDIAL